jgi:DNA-binding CsgD family transcriptional regulator
MDVHHLARRGTDLCHAVMKGHDVLPDVLQLLADCVGTDLVSCATFAAESSLHVPGGAHPLLLLHGRPSLGEQELRDWRRLLPTHPYAAHLAIESRPSPLLTDVVDLGALERTEVYQHCLAPWGARYQLGLVLDRSPDGMALLSLWRADQDFAPGEVEPLQSFARALAAALDVAVNLEALRQLSGHQGDGGLSPRQQQVTALVALGLTNEQIARRLGLTERTVRKHLELSFARTGARSRTELAVRWRTAARPGPEVTAGR